MPEPGATQALHWRLGGFLGSNHELFIWRLASSSRLLFQKNRNLSSQEDNLILGYTLKISPKDMLQCIKRTQGPLADFFLKSAKAIKVFRWFEKGRNNNPERDNHVEASTQYRPDDSIWIQRMYGLWEKKIRAKLQEGSLFLPLPKRTSHPLDFDPDLALQVRVVTAILSTNIFQVLLSPVLREKASQK